MGLTPSGPHVSAPTLEGRHTHESVPDEGLVRGFTLSLGSSGPLSPDRYCIILKNTRPLRPW